MTDPLDCFSAGYQSARARFLDAIKPLNCMHAPYFDSTPGAQGEALAIDVVKLGSQTSKVLLVTSACHGVEGYAGSAAQIGVLRDAALHAALKKHDVSILLVHALNPFGFSYSRRVTSGNVDLNRNAATLFVRPLPVNESYRALHPLLVPEQWPPSAETESQLGTAIQSIGLRDFQTIVTKGQYEFPGGIFYGGREPTWNLLTFRLILSQWLSHARAVAWIDLHTGLGASGVGERIFTGGGSDHAQTLAHQWWGKLTRAGEDDSTSSQLQGTLADLVSHELGARLVTSMTLEFGTLPALEVLTALRADASVNGIHRAARDKRHAVARAVRDVFFVDTPDWKKAVFEQSMDAISAAVTGLGGAE